MGFIDSLFGGGTSGASKKGMKNLDLGLGTMIEQWRKSQDNFNTDVAMGRYNPDAALQLAKDDIAHSFDINSNNLAAKMGGYGYKKGDSNIAQGQRNLSAKSDLEGQQLLMAIRDKFAQDKDRGRAGVAQAAGNYAQTASSTGNTYLDYGARQEAQGGLGGLIGGLSSFLPTGGKSSNPTYTGTTRQGPPNVPNIAKYLSGMHWG